MLQLTFSTFRQSVRRLAAIPGIAALCVLMLGLGIGVATAIFSVVDGALLKPLPFAQADRLVEVWERNPSQGHEHFTVAEANFLDWRERSQAFASMGAFTDRSVNLTGDEAPERVAAALTTVGFFPTLAVEPLLGRLLLPEEDRAGVEGKVTLLSEALWKRRFAASRDILGTSLTINGEPHTVVGVIPSLPNFLERDLYLPLGPDAAAERDDHHLEVIARLAPGITLEGASAEMNALATTLAAEHPATNSGWEAGVGSLFHTVVDEGFRRSLQLLMAAVFFVVLIVCFNLTNLLLSRAVARRREFTVRSALGASPGRLLIPWVVDALLLGVAGGTLGALLALWGVDLLKALSPDTIPRLDEVTVDLRVLAFTFSMALLAGLASVVAPAWLASTTHLRSGLVDGGRGTTSGKGRQRLQQALVIAEVALSLVLLVGAGLLIRSFQQVRSVDTGIELENRTVFELHLPQASYPEQADVSAFFEQLNERLRSIPGSRSAGALSALPFGPFNTVMQVDRPEWQSGESAVWASWRIVTPETFEALGIPLLSGRTFDSSDTPDASQAVVINQSLAQRLWPDQSPLGRRINSQGVVVGVVADVRERGPETAPAPMLFLSLSQARWSNLPLVVHADSPIEVLAPQVRTILAELAPDLPLGHTAPLADYLSSSLAPRRFHLLLLTLFAAVALLLVVGGIYGMMAYLVHCRMPELSIRMALGASREAITRRVLTQGAGLVALGSGIGLLVAAWLSRYLTSFLFEVQVLDLSTFSIAACSLFLVGLGACLVPARRAARLELARLLDEN